MKRGRRRRRREGKRGGSSKGVLNLTSLTPLGRSTSIKGNRFAWRSMKGLGAKQRGGLYVKEQTEQGNNRSSQW